MGIPIPETDIGEIISQNSTFQHDDWYWVYFNNNYEILPNTVRVFGPFLWIRAPAISLPIGTKITVEAKLIAPLTNFKWRLHWSGGTGGPWQFTPGTQIVTGNIVEDPTLVSLFFSALIAGPAEAYVEYFKIWLNTVRANGAFRLARTYVFMPLKNPLYEYWDRGGGQSTHRIADRQSASNIIISSTPP